VIVNQLDQGVPQSRPHLRIDHDSERTRPRVW